MQWNRVLKSGQKNAWVEREGSFNCILKRTAEEEFIEAKVLFFLYWFKNGQLMAVIHQ